MSAQDRQTTSRLKESILHEAFRFDFFQLVYLLEHWQRREVSGARDGDEGLTAIGGQGPMSAEGLRLRPDRGLAFAPADVRWAGPLPAKEDERGELRRFDRDGEVYQIIVHFMGLYGFTTPTPIYFTELINSPDFDSGPLTELLDVFNHRLLSFYYRAWQKYRYPYRYEPGARDEVSGHVLSFVGLRGRRVQEQTRLPIPRLIRYVGLLAPRPRPLISLRLMLADYFHLPQIRIKPWILRWTEIAEEQLNSLGAGNCSLGQDFTVGSQIPDRSGKFRVRLGPISFKEFSSFLPDGEKFRQLSALVHLWAGNRFDFDFEFIIRRQDIPEACMHGASGARLGWTGWITSGGGLDHDPSVIFPPRHFARN